MRTRAILSPLHKTQGLYVRPLITNLTVYSTTLLLVLDPKYDVTHAALKAVDLPENVKLYEHGLHMKE